MQKRNLRRLGASRDMGAFRRLRMIYACKDGQLVWMASTGHIGGASFQALVDWMHSEGMAPDWLRAIDWFKFDYVEQGPEMIDRLEQVFDAFFATKTKAEMLQWSLAHRLMMAPLQNLREVLDDPQLAVRQSWRNLHRWRRRQCVSAANRMSGAMWSHA
jgi:crotonobetainyl-CoA:carnitine CoA-transferase CaiB-like acyl-CoA transferase